jgi:hypothetical protein
MAIAIGTLLVDQAMTALTFPSCCTFCPGPSPETASPMRPPSVACSFAKLIVSAGARIARERVDGLAARDEASVDAAGSLASPACAVEAVYCAGVVTLGTERAGGSGSSASLRPQPAKAAAARVSAAVFVMTIADRSPLTRSTSRTRCWLPSRSRHYPPGRTTWCRSGR